MLILEDKKEPTKVQKVNHNSNTITMENLFCEGCENHFKPLMDFDIEVPNYPDLQIKDYKRTLALYTRKDGQVQEALLKYPEKSGGIPTDKKLQFMNDFFKYLIRL